MHLITHLLTSPEVAERQAGIQEQNGSIFISSCLWKPGAPARAQPHWGSRNHRPVPRSRHWTHTAEESPVWTHGPLRGDREKLESRKPLIVPILCTAQHRTVPCPASRPQRPLPCSPCLPWPPAAKSLQDNHKVNGSVPTNGDIGCLAAWVIA